MDVTSDSQTLVAGYELGFVVVWNKIKQYEIIIIPPLGLFKSAVIQVKFWKDAIEGILASDASGNVQQICVKESMYSTSLYKSYYFDRFDPTCSKLLLQKESDAFYDIEVLKPYKF